MKRSNRNFYDSYDDCDVEELSDDSKVEFKYDTSVTNLFNILTPSNLDIQELDYQFMNELDNNSGRFDVIVSKRRNKKSFSVILALIVLTVLLHVGSLIVKPNLESIINFVIGDLEKSEVSLFVIVFSYIINQVKLVLQIVLICLIIALVVSVIATRPFFSKLSGYNEVIITDDIGFYRIEINHLGNTKTNLERLYIIKYIESELGLSLKDKVISVSYYSSYCISALDSSSCVLDLPNDTFTESNMYDLDFCKRDYSRADYKKLLSYIKETEDGD